MNWLTLVLVIFQYGPQLIDAIRTLFLAIANKNADKGKEAVTKASNLAAQLVRSYQTRNDLTNDQKREQAWKDLVDGMALAGITLSETNARTLTQLAYQDVSGK